MCSAFQIWEIGPILFLTETSEPTWSESLLDTTLAGSQGGMSRLIAPACSWYPKSRSTEHENSLECSKSMRLRYGLEVRFGNRRDVGHIAEFIESTFFELADSFFGDTETIGEFLKGLDSAVSPEGESSPNDQFFSAVEPIEHVRESSSQSFPADFAHSRGAMFVADVDP